MQTLFRVAIHLDHQREQLPEKMFQARVARIERLCDWLNERSPPQVEAARLQRRYQKHRLSLFVFLYRPDVGPTNNVSERPLHPAVIHRKVIGSVRSEWGVQTYAALASVIDIAKLTGSNAFEALQHLSGKPFLPLPSSV